MLKNLNKTKKKKGFTLIELVIVLAVLAIIALIAIPNFNKVRNDSKVKADLQTCETIKNVTTMAIANQDIKVLATGTEITITPKSGVVITVAEISDAVANKFEWGKDKAGNVVGEANYATALKEVKKPQQKDFVKYTVTINLENNSEIISVKTDKA